MEVSGGQAKIGKSRDLIPEDHLRWFELSETVDTTLHPSLT